MFVMSIIISNVPQTTAAWTGTAMLTVINERTLTPVKEWVELTADSQT